MMVKAYRVSGEICYARDSILALLRSEEASLLRRGKTDAADYVASLANQFEQHT